MQTKFQQAVELAEAGFYVFRLKPNEKTPAAFGWQQEATRDPEKLKGFFDNNRDFNIGIYTEKYEEPESGFPCALTVVDVDTKPGKNGAKTMKALDAMGCDFPPTFTQITATGGQHLIYSHDVALASGANKLGEHVDLKSAGAYIVGAGSTINGIPYTIDQKAGLQPIPSWIPHRCHPPMPKGARASDLSDDSQQAVSRAIQTASLTEAHSGGRNDTAFKLGCQIRDLGLSEPMTEEILQGWNGYNVTPPLAPEEITAVTGFVYKHAKLSQGNKSPQAEFEVIPHDPKIDDSEKRRIYKVNWSEIEAGNPPRALIQNYLEQDSTSIGYGDSNAGKTFVFLDMAYHIAAGLAWAGHKTLQGGVIYLAAEGGRSMRNRIQALKQRHQTPKLPFALIPCQINLLDSNTDFKAFINLIEAAEKDPEIGAVRLIVIDTLSRAMHGGNENDSVDMGKFVTNLTFIQQRFHCHVLVVHHSGKDAAKGARGHSLLRAAIDTEIEIVKTSENEGEIRTRKQRDMEFAQPLGFRLTSTPVGADEDKQPITSCTVTYHDPANRADQDNFKMEPRDTVTLLALQQGKGRRLGSHDNVLDGRAWRQFTKDFNISTVANAKPWPKSDNSFVQAFLRSRDRLVGFGMVEEVEPNQWRFVAENQPDAFL